MWLDEIKANFHNEPFPYDKSGSATSVLKIGSCIQSVLKPDLLWNEMGRDISHSSFRSMKEGK